MTSCTLNAIPQFLPIVVPHISVFPFLMIDGLEMDGRNPFAKVLDPSYQAYFPIYSCSYLL